MTHLPPTKPCTDPRHTGPIRAQLGCNGPGPADGPAAEHLREAIDVGCTRGDEHDHVADHRAEVLREAADIAARAARACGSSETGQYAASVAAGIGKELRSMADKISRSAVRPLGIIKQPTDGTEHPADTARRYARRLRAVEQLCAGRPGYHTVTVKQVLTAMSEADDEAQRPEAEAEDPICGNRYDESTCQLAPEHDGSHADWNRAWDHGRAPAVTEEPGR
ncbi:hypothetical protein [Streptomyces sp. NPDC014685]|uniref:hypothetical protein n=1 Tax=Streptomyces sp. NPDC014685 TaxID=3364881 RepID=UPI0036FCDA23